jgi:hypothetical protein
MFIIDLNYPRKVQDFFAGLFPLIVFDVVPTDDLYQYIFHFEEIEPEESTLSD